MLLTNNVQTIHYPYRDTRLYKLSKLPSIGRSTNPKPLQKRPEREKMPSGTDVKNEAEF